MHKNELDEIDRCADAYLKSEASEDFSDLCKKIYPHLLEYATHIMVGSLRFYSADVVSDTILRMRDKTIRYYKNIDGGCYFGWCCKLMKEERSKYIEQENVERHTIHSDDNTSFECIIGDMSISSCEYEFDGNNRIIRGGSVAMSDYINRIVRDIISKLPTIYKVVMESVYLNDKSYDAACEELGISYDVLKSRLYFAKNKVRVAVNKHHPEIKYLLDEFSRQ